LLTNFPFKAMSHQFTSGVFLNSQPAWHKLGTVLDGTLPAREAFRIANADWETIAAPIFTADMVEILGHKAITRADNDTIVQNEQLIRMAEALHEDTTMDAVCVLAGGKRVTFTAKLNGAVGEVVKGDEVQQHLVGCTSHDGTIAFQLIFSPIRVVCQNTSPLL
jgi:hypothetical protein